MNGLSAMRFRLEVHDPDALSLFEACRELLERFGPSELAQNFGVPAAHPSPDGYLTITAANGMTSHYVCEAKRRIDSNAFSNVVAALRKSATGAGMRPLLLTEYVNPSLAERLHQAKIAYLDVAGNAYLTGDSLVYIWLQGLKPTERPERVSRAFQSTGLQLIALLLSRPSVLDQTYREIARQAGLSLGSTSRVLAELRNLGFIKLEAPGRDTLVNTEKLLGHWDLGYATRLRPRLKPQTFRQAEDRPLKRLHELLPGGIRNQTLIGGELAAALVTRHLRPQTAAFHVPKHQPLLPLIREMRLIPDRGGNIVFLEQFGESSAWRWDAKEKANLMNPLLVRAELFQHMPDDRLAETADIILDKYLAPIFNENAAV